MDAQQVLEALRNIAGGGEASSEWTLAQACGALLDEGGPVADYLREHFGGGRLIFVQTITFYYVGQLVLETPRAYHIRTATWIRDMGEDVGRALHPQGSCETEYSYPPGIVVEVRKGATVAAVPWTRDLPFSGGVRDLEARA